MKEDEQGPPEFRHLVCFINADEFNWINTGHNGGKQLVMQSAEATAKKDIVFTHYLNPSVDLLYLLRLEEQI